MGAEEVILEYKYGLSLVNDEEKVKISSKSKMYFYETEHEKKYVDIKIFDNGTYEISKLQDVKKSNYSNYKLIKKSSSNEEIKDFIFKKNKLEDFTLTVEGTKEKLSIKEFDRLKKYIKEAYAELYVKNEKLDMEKKCNDSEEYFLIGYGEELKIKDIYFYTLSDYLDKPINYIDYVIYEYDNCSIIKKGLKLNKGFYFPKTNILKEYLNFIFENKVNTPNSIQWEK